jgi:alkaline phosphatase
MNIFNMRQVALGAALVVAAGMAPMTSAVAQGGVAGATGNVIFFHPDGTGLNHWRAARLYFRGADGSLNWDRLPNMAVYRGHMANLITGSSHAGATTHAFGFKVDGFGSFGMDGDGNLVPPTNRAIRSLSGFSGSIMREAANAGIPVGVINDGHIGEPGTGAFLAEAGNRDNWQEITRQMIMGRPGMNDADPWVIMGGGEADTLPAGATTLHRNVNQERGQPVNSRASLRTDHLNLQALWNARGSGNLSNDPMQQDDYIVVRTRAEFERLRKALAANPRYAPRVLGLFAFQDLFNDRNEEDLIARGFVRAGVAPGTVGPEPGKQSRIVLWGDHSPAEPGYNPPTFAEMVEVTLTILERAAQSRPNPAQRRFFLVAEPESIDNFGNNNNAVGMLQAMRDADEAIGVALRHLERDRRTLIITAADSDAGGMQVVSPPVAGITPRTNVLPAGTAPDLAGTAAVNPAVGLPAISIPVDGVEGRATPLFVTEPDQFGQRKQFGILWSGTGDYSGGILTRAAGLNAHLLNRRSPFGERFDKGRDDDEEEIARHKSLDPTPFSERFDNTDVYRMKYLTLFGRMLPRSETRAPGR